MNKEALASFIRRSTSSQSLPTRIKTVTVLRDVAGML